MPPVAVNLGQLLDRRTLTLQVNRIIDQPSFLYDRYFKPRTREVYTETVDFEVVTQPTRKMARFRFRGQEAVVVGKAGSEIRTFKLPYLREKKTLSAMELFRESQPLGQIYNPQAAQLNQARQRAIARDQKDLKDRIVRRREWMAAMMLQSGKIEYPGDADGGPAFRIDLGVDPAYFDTLSGTDLWTDAASNPAAQIFSWQRMINATTGQNLAEVILGWEAAEAFLANVKVRAALTQNNFRAGALTLNPSAAYLGNFANVDWYVYSKEYIKDDGTTANLLPQDAALWMPSPGDFTSEVIYGPVPEIDAVFVGEFFSKMWPEPDPPAWWILAASSVLPMAYEPGSWGMTIVV